MVPTGCPEEMAFLQHSEKCDLAICAVGDDLVRKRALGFSVRSSSQEGILHILFDHQAPRAYRLHPVQSVHF